MSSADHATLTSGPINRTLLRMTLGMLVGHFAMTIFNLTDTYFVAQLGTNELAAMSFTFPAVFLVSALIFGIGIGASSVISRAIGRGDLRRVQQLTTHVLLLAIVVAVLLSLLGLSAARSAFYVMGARDAVLELTMQYMRIWFFGMPLVVIPMIGNNAIRATGDAMTPGLIMLTAALANLVLDPLLIFGLLRIARSRDRRGGAGHAIRPRGRGSWPGSTSCTRGSTC